MNMKMQQNPYLVDPQMMMMGMTGDPNVMMGMSNPMFMNMGMKMGSATNGDDTVQVGQNNNQQKEDI